MTQTFLAWDQEWRPTHKRWLRWIRFDIGLGARLGGDKAGGWEWFRPDHPRLPRQRGQEGRQAWQGKKQILNVKHTQYMIYMHNILYTTGIFLKNTLATSQKNPNYSAFHQSELQKNV